MRGSRTTTNLILAGALGLGSLISLAAPAMAESPEAEEMILVLDGGNPEPQPGDKIAVPTPDPEIDDKAPVPQPEPDPQPELLDDKAPAPQDPGPEGPDDKAPLPQDPGPEGPDDEITSDPGCTFTHGCPGEGTPDGHCFDEAGEVVDPSECIPTDDEPEVEVESESTDRGALPRTGAGLALMALAGTALTGAGAALRKVAKR